MQMDGFYLTAIEKRQSVFQAEVMCKFTQQMGVHSVYC